MASYYWLSHDLTDQSIGDGTVIGFCPTNPPDLRCLSSAECRICKLIAPNYEGCDFRSITPVCDGDKDDTTEITTTYASDKTPKCVGCKKSGKYLIGADNYLYKKLLV